MSLGKLKPSVLGSAGGGSAGDRAGRHWASSKDVNKHDDVGTTTTMAMAATEDDGKKMPEAGRSYGKILRTLRRKLPWNSPRSYAPGAGGDVDGVDVAGCTMKAGQGKSGTSKGRGAICPMPAPIISSAAHQVLRRLGVTRDCNLQHQPTAADVVGQSAAVLPAIFVNGDQSTHRTAIERRQSVDVQLPELSSHISPVPLMTSPSSDSPSVSDYILAQYELRRLSQTNGESYAGGAAGGGLTVELFRLAKYGWYWGPITRGEAEEKLADQTDGAFLVRDSSDDRYLLSLSFRSFGKTLHTRIEHCNGVFSFYAQPESEGHDSIVGLIEHSMSYSQSGVFCYSRARTPGAPSYPVRLTKPVSRFMEVRSLQYLCRFVIRQYIRVDLIQELPLPTRIRGYIEEGHY